MKKGMILLLTGALLLSGGCGNAAQPIQPETTAPAATEGTTETQTEPPSAGMDPAKGIYPVLNGYDRLIGGLVEGQWTSADEVAKHLKGTEAYKVYTLDKFQGEFKSEKITTQTYLDSSTGYWVQFASSAEDRKFSLGAQWNALPRPVSEVPAADYDSYKGAVDDLLISTGTPGEPLVKRVITCDVDGDESEEAIIIATNITDGDLDGISEGNPPESKGKYAMVVLRRAGQEGYTAEALLVTKDYLEMQEVEAIADFDGDGVMEILLDQEDLEVVGAEGFSFSTETIWDLSEGSWIKRLEKFSNPI